VVAVSFAATALSGDTSKLIAINAISVRFIGPS
jgi:hypothetical protein